VHLAGGDRNAFERYRFEGAHENGSLLFGATLGLYPNREIIDASLCVVVDGVQHCVHASARLAPGVRLLHVGPFSLEVLRPLQVMRILVQGPLADELGLEADLTFCGSCAPLEARRHTERRAGPLGQDTTRFSQWGTWQGHILLDGRHHRIEPEVAFGARERSWGTRPVGEPAGGAPPLALPQQLAATAIVRIGAEVIDAEIAEDELGRRTFLSAHRSAAPVPSSPAPVPLEPFPGPDPGSGAPAPAGEPLRDVAVTIAWEPGTRRPSRTRLHVAPWNADPLDLELIPLQSMALRGLGYQSPDWMHGSFKAEAAVGRESWVVADLDPEDVHNVHWLSVCRVRHGDALGLAFLELLAVGPHAPSGLTGFTDGFTGLDVPPADDAPGPVAAAGALARPGSAPDPGAPS